MTEAKHPRQALDAFTMILLRCEDRYLMLRRSESKSFAPGRWTGIGGRVEPDEFADLYAAALRELSEETGIDPAAVQRLTLRRSLLQARPGQSNTVLLYFTGELPEPVAPDCSEGTLHWLTESEITGVDVIENTALVIPLLIDDIRRDPEGSDGVTTGTARFSESGALETVVWSH